MCEAMTQKMICKISGSSSEYDIEIGSGSLNKQAQFLAALAKRFVIITDDIVAPLYGKQLQASLLSFGLEVHLLTFPHGEQNKTRITKEHLENQMFEKGLGRDICVIALGGGVVTDIAGYLAATYCRGIPHVIFPTTLLGMVDAGIGGKTSVNVPYGKNMIGCIYQPRKVVIDPSTLASLSKKELANGVVEMIKHGLIASNQLFEDLENHSEEIFNSNSSLLTKMIFENCRIKKEIIEQDEKDYGKRQLLNFGHTVGHALEHLTNHSLAHGEAVAIGIIIESYLSLKLGVLDHISFERIQSIFIQYNLPLKLPSDFSAHAILKAMSLDKKSEGGQPRFVMIRSIGTPVIQDLSYSSPIDTDLIEKAINWMTNDLCCR